MISFYSLQCFDNSEITELFSPQNSEIDVLARNDLVEWLHQLQPPCEESEAVVSYVNRNMENLFQELMQFGDEVRSVNASELLFHCLQYGNECNALRDILTHSLTILRPEYFPITLSAANTVKRFFELCMSIDYVTTTSIVAEVMSDEVIEGVIKNIGASTSVGDGIIELFGARLMFGEILQPGFSVKSLTASWVKFNFHRCLVHQFVDAFSSPERYRLVFFVRELCTLGYSPTVGALLDVLLANETFTTMMEATIAACKKAVEGGPSIDPLAAPVPEAVSIFTSIMRVARQTFPAMSSLSNYNFNIESYPPVASICGQLPFLVEILRSPNGRMPNALTRVKGTICLLFKELIAFRMRYVDIQVRDCGFFPVFLALCEQFPNNNTVAQILNECFSVIFSRSSLVDDDVLLTYFTEGPGIVYLQRVSSFATDDTYHFSAIRSHSHEVLRLLTNSAQLKEKKGTLATIINDVTVSKVKALSTYLDEELTGEDFASPGSTNVTSPINQNCINFAGVREREEGGSMSPVGSPKIPEPRDSPLVAPTVDGFASPVDGYDSLQRETFLLRDCSSAQVQAYPSFRNVQLLFASTSD
eukprot:gene13286-9127_t